MTDEPGAHDVARDYQHDYVYSPEQLGRLAYHAYGETVDGVAVNGDRLPNWEALRERVRAAWQRAALLLHALGVNDERRGLPLHVTLAVDRLDHPVAPWNQPASSTEEDR